MNLYNQLLEKQKEKKEILRLKQNKRSLDYYYKNKDYILKRQAQKKLLHPNYYKEWYEKNKIELNERRRINSGAYKKVNKSYNKKPIYNNTSFNNQKQNQFLLTF